MGLNSHTPQPPPTPPTQSSSVLRSFSNFQVLENHMYRTWLHLRNRAINIRLVAPTLGRDFIPDPSVRGLLYKYPSRSTNRGAWSAFKRRLTPRKASRPSQIAGKCRRKTTQQLHIPTCMYPLPTPRQSWTHSLPTPTTAVCVLHAVVVEWLLTLSGDDDGSESRTRRILTCVLSKAQNIYPTKSLRQMLRYPI